MMTETQHVYSQRTMPTQMDASFMQLRLSNDNILKKIEMFLSAKRKRLIRQGEKYREEQYSVGNPLVNQEGLNNILNMVALRTDPLIVQGNFKLEQYDDYIEQSRKELVYAVVVKREEWGIRETDIEIIVDNIMAFVEPFMSRLIDNKERDSYAPTFKTHEAVVTNPEKNRNMIGMSK